MRQHDFLCKRGLSSVVSLVHYLSISCIYRSSSLGNPKGKRRIRSESVQDFHVFQHDFHVATAQAPKANAATTDAGAYEWHEWDVYAVYAYANAGHEWDAHAYEWHDRHVYANARRAGCVSMEKVADFDIQIGYVFISYSFLKSAPSLFQSYPSKMIPAQTRNEHEQET